MTMKKSKTLQHIAAVAVVLLALCLVFIMPVSAEETNAATVDDFAELKAALVAQNTTINIVAPITVTEQLNINYSVTINGNNHLLTASNSVRKLFTINDDNKGAVSPNTIIVVFNNVNLTSNYPSNSDSTTRLIDTRGGAFALTLKESFLRYNKDVSSTQFQPLTIGGYTNDKASITIENTLIDAGLSGYGIIVFNPVEMEIKDTTAISGYGALYFKNNTDTSGNPYGAKGSKVSIVNSVLSTENTHDGDDDSFGTIIFEEDNIQVTVDAASEIIAIRTAPENTETDDVYQGAFSFSKNSYEYKNLGWEAATPVSGNFVTVNGKVTMTDTRGGANAVLLLSANGENTLTFENGARANSGEIDTYINKDKQLVTTTVDENDYYKVVPKYSISADLSEIAFGEVNVGYEADALPKVTVKVTNDGPTELTINPCSEGTETYWTCFDNNIKVGVEASVDLNLYLMPGLLPGEYSQDVIISVNEDSDVKIILPLTVTVNAVDGAYTIVYDAKTGTVVTETRYLDADEKFSLTPVSFDTESTIGLGFSNPGYFFAGWNATSADGTYYDYDDEHYFKNPSELFGDGNVVHLYALWCQEEIAGIEIVPEYNPETKVTKFAFTDVDEEDIVDAESEDAYLIPDAYPDNSTTIQLNNGVQLTLEFENSDDRDAFSSNPSSLDAPILSALVVYPWADTQLGGLLGGSTSNLVMFEMSNLTSIPTIISVFNQDVENYINDYCGDDAGILTMISAPGADNTNISNVWVTFEIYKYGILTNEDGFSGYHVDSNGNVEPLERDVDFFITEKTDAYDDDYWEIILYSDLGFSSYAVGYVEPTSSDDTGGSGDDNDDDENQNGGNTGNNDQDTGNNTPNYNGGGGGKKPTTVTPTVPPTEEPTDDPTDVPGEQVPETPVTPETPEEPSTPAPILAVLAGLGAAVVLRRK